MTSHQQLDNNELDKKYLESLPALFKLRNNLKYPMESPESQKIDSLPIFDRNQITLFTNQLKTKENVEEALKSIDFHKYKFNSVELQSIKSDTPKDISITLAYYQILSRVYFQPKLTSEDFALIIEVLLKIYSPQLKDLINLINSAFYISYLNAQSSHISWTENCVQNVLNFFVKNKSLSSSFYNILINYLTLFNFFNEDSQTIHILKELLKIFKSNYPIVQVKDLSKIVDLIHPILFEYFNSQSLQIFAYISKIDKKSTEKDIVYLPGLFTTLVFKNAENQQMIIKTSEQERIHELPAVFTDEIPEFDYKIHEIDTFNNLFYTVPKELYRKPKLSSIVPDNTKNVIKQSLKIFFDILDPKLTEIFFNEMNKALLNCMKDNDYNGFAAYFVLHSIVKNSSTKNLFDNNIHNFYPTPKIHDKNSHTSNEISFGDFFFNPENTIYGPKKLDPIINIFRSSILFLTSPDNLNRFIQSMKGCPFLMAEQIGRLCYLFETNIFTNFNKYSEQMFRTIAREMKVLQMIRAGVQPRNPFFLFFVHFLTNDRKSPNENTVTNEDCLKSLGCVDAIFPFIFESGVMDILILMITKSFLLLKTGHENKCNVEPAVSFLFNAASRNEQIAPKIYRLVSTVVKYRPALINRFVRFLDLMMNELQQKHSQEAFDNVFTLIELISDYSSKNSDFDSDLFKPKYFRIIASHIKLSSEYKLLNLIAGGYNLGSKGIILIKQPIFIPLLLIACADDYQKINQLIEWFLLLASKSELNCRALHDGDLDMILLKHLNKENPLKYKGFYIPQLCISEKIENTTVLQLLHLIIQSKSSFAISTKMIELTVKSQNLAAAKLINNIMSGYKNIPTPEYPIGSLNPFCSITGLNDKSLKGDMSIAFWLKIDPLLLSRTTAVIYLISIIDKNECSFNIILQNNFLFASYETKKKKTSVCLCQRMNSNCWTHFALTFSNSLTETPLISTTNDFKKLHDSEFCYVEFAPGPIEVRFGGFSYGDRSKIYSNLQYGNLSRVYIYNRFLSNDEIVSIIQDSLDKPLDFIATSNPDAKSSIKMDKPSSSTYKSNHYYIESLNDCLSNDQTVNNLIESFRTIKSRPLIDEIVSILEKIISFTKDKTISSRLASILLNSEMPDYRLYKSFYYIFTQIVDKETQFCWFEDILINIQIWCRSPTFHEILSDYSKLLINYPQYFNQSFSFYFLNQFDLLVNTSKEQRNEKALNEFMLFIERYPKIALNGVNITKETVNNLICYATKTSDENKVIYLEVIEKIADSIIKVGFNEFEYIYYFVSMNNLDISLHAILTLHQLYLYLAKGDDKQKSFHSIVYTILKALKVPLKDLFVKLEPYVEKYRNLISLTCAIGLKTGQIPSQIPPTVTLNSCWYLMPLLFAISTSDNTQFVDLIARNVFKSNHLDTIVFLATYLNLFAEQAMSKSKRNILYFLLSRIFQLNSKTNTNSEKKFQLFLHLFSASFFKINAPLMSEDIGKIINPAPEKPVEIKKVKVVDFDSFQKMARNARDFVKEIEDKRASIRAKYLEMKKKREAAEQEAESQTAQNQPQQVQFKDDEEFYHLEEINESVKSFLLHFHYTSDDLGLLKRAHAVFTSSLKNYTIGDVQSEAKTLFKSKVPVFDNDDLIQLMNNFIDIYQDKLQPERHLSFDSSPPPQNSKPSSPIPSPLVNSPPPNQQFPIASTPSSNTSILSQVEGELSLHPIQPYEKQLKIFDYFAEKLNEKMLQIAILGNILIILKPDIAFIKKIQPINSEICANIIFSEEARAKNQRIISEKTVRLVRNNLIGYSFTPYLMKREKSIQKVYRFNTKNPVFTSPNAKLISFDSRSDIYFEVPFSDENADQSAQQRKITQQRPMSQPPRSINSRKLSLSGSPSSDSEYVIQCKEKRLSIDTQKVINILYIDSKTIELIDCANQPFLIQFINEEMAKKCTSKILNNHINRFNISEKYNQDTLNSKKMNWVKGFESTFSYISFLNFFNGRNYEDSSKYPVFPSLTPMDKITDKSLPSLSLTFFEGSQSSTDTNKSVQFDNRLYVLPELYYLFESDSIENVYNRRKLLEEVSKNDKPGKDSRLLKWIETVFKTSEFSIPRNLIKFKLDIKQQFLDLNESEIVYAIPYIENSFYALLSSGEAIFFKIKFIDRNQQQQQLDDQSLNKSGKRRASEILPDIDIEIKTEKSNKSTIINNEEISSLKFAPLNIGYIPSITAFLNRYIKFGFVAYNSNKAYFVGWNNIIRKNIFLENPIFHNSVALGTPSTIVPITNYFLKDNKIGNSILCNVRSRVTCLQSSSNFGIIAFGSEDCKVRIRSLNNGEKIATVKLDDSEVPTMILITESWGFVVVFCASKLYVLSVNGKIVKEYNDFAQFSRWFTFKSADDFDYIAIVDDKLLSFKYFEVMHPEVLKEADLDRKLATMKYDSRYNCFILLADNGKVTLVPADI